MLDNLHGTQRTLNNFRKIGWLKQKLKVVVVVMVVVYSAWNTRVYFVVDCCEESGSPVPMPPDVHLPNLKLDGVKSSQDSVLSETQSAGDTATPRNVPLVNLTGSPTSKRRQPSSVSSRRMPRQRDHTEVFRTDDDPVWVPSSAPTKLSNGYRHRGTSPSKSFDMDLSPGVASYKSPIQNGQFPHSRVAALQHQGRTPVYLHRALIFRSTSKSRPNNIGGKMSVRPYIGTSVRPSTKSFFDLNEIWYVGRDR